MTTCRYTSGLAPNLETCLLVPVHGRDLLSWNLAGEWVLSKRWVALLEFYSSYEMGPIFGRCRERSSSLAPAPMEKNA